VTLSIHDLPDGEDQRYVFALPPDTPQRDEDLIVKAIEDMFDGARVLVVSADVESDLCVDELSEDEFCELLTDVNPPGDKE